MNADLTNKGTVLNYKPRLRHNEEHSRECFMFFQIRMIRVHPRPLFLLRKNLHEVDQGLGRLFQTPPRVEFQFAVEVLSSSEKVRSR